jgi:predicted negative regulator of RcsB-dependent stress response
MIAIILAGLGVVALAAYFGAQWLEGRDAQAQQQLARGIELFHARVDTAASDDPYAKSPIDPVFKTEAAKYKAAAAEFSSVASKYGSSKLAVVARYYLGLSELRQGQQDEAVRTLETVSNNSKDRTTSYLARKLLARLYINSGNPKGAQALLEGMIKDPQCDLPREDLRVELSRALVTQGKRDEALKVLRDTGDAGRGLLHSMVARELTRIEGTPVAKTRP